MVFMASFQSSLVLVDYQVNRDFYELHCTNKDKPDMNCHGKCQLNSEQKQSIRMVAKFCTEFNFIASREVDWNLKYVLQAIEQDPISTYAIQACSYQEYDEIPHPPES